MVVMIIFLVLSVIFVIGTIIYIKRKNKGIRKKEPKEKHKKKHKKNMIDFLKIKIKDNYICFGNRYSCIIKLGNIDYNMLSDSEQEAIENILMQSALAIDYPIQFFSTTEYISTSKITAAMKQNKLSNYKVQEYKQYLIDYLDNLMENRTISVVKNYAIISYDGIYENAIQELDRKVASFKGNLLRAKIICELLSEDEIYDLLYREINRNSALTINELRNGVKNLYVGKKKKAKRN